MQVLKTQVQISRYLRFPILAILAPHHIPVSSFHSLPVPKSNPLLHSSYHLFLFRYFVIFEQSANSRFEEGMHRRLAFLEQSRLVSFYRDCHPQFLAQTVPTDPVA